MTQEIIIQSREEIKEIDVEDLARLLRTALSKYAADTSLKIEFYPRRRK